MSAWKEEGKGNLVNGEQADGKLKMSDDMLYKLSKKIAQLTKVRSHFI